MKDLYDILGVKKSASDAEIKSAYRKLAKELHPDRNAGDEAVADRFKSVSAAYSILGDKEKRTQYDNGMIDESGAQRGFGPGGPFGAGGPFSAGAQGQQGFSGQDFEDILRQFTGGAGAGGGPGGASHFEFRAGPDGGTGGQTGGGDFFSNLFGGFGGGGAKKASSARRSPLKGQDALYALEIEFEDAIKGASKRLKLKNGKTVDVKIPAGVKDKQQIRLAGQGEGGMGGGKGDALIEIRIKPHSFYKRDGDNITMDIPITIDEAILGGSISIPTIWGTVSMKIPKGTSSGKRLRLKGKGVHRGKTKGDQLVNLKIVLPEELDDELRDAIETWRKRHSYKVRDSYGVDG